MSPSFSPAFVPTNNAIRLRTNVVTAIIGADCHMFALFAANETPTANASMLVATA